MYTFFNKLLVEQGIFYFTWDVNISKILNRGKILL